MVASTLQPGPIEIPYLCRVASGGHTFLARVDDPSRYAILGQTLDDAAGEAFDKGARMLGLSDPGADAVAVEFADERLTYAELVAAGGRWRRGWPRSAWSRRPAWGSASNAAPGS